MSEDFTTRLRLQLREAAEREEHRGGFMRALTAVRPFPRLSLGTLAGAVAVGLVLLAGLWMISSTATDTETTTPPAGGPRVVANVPLADGLGHSAAVAFGSVWLSDTNHGNLLRVDPRTRRVTARIPVGTEVSLAASDDAVWAIPRQAGVATSPLMRIDPRTNRIVARIAMRSPNGEPFNGTMIVAGPRIWVVGGTALLAVDPLRNRPVRDVELAGAFQVRDVHLSGNELWVTRDDGSITRFDAVTGRRLSAVGWRSNGFLSPFEGRLVKVAKRSVSLVDPDSGRSLWRTRLGTQLNDSTIAGGRILVDGVNGSGARDSLWALDPRTGRTVGTMTVPGFGVVGLFPVGRDAWIVTADGRVIVVAP